MATTHKGKRREEIALAAIAAIFGALVAWSTYQTFVEGCMTLRYSSVCAETEPMQFWGRIALGVIIALTSAWFSYYNSQRLLRSRHELR